jgi:hypothetical protein
MGIFAAHRFFARSNGNYCRHFHKTPPAWPTAKTVERFELPA